MRLLIITQAVDQQDTTLGFFVRWIEKLAPRFTYIHVICLRQGIYDLPKNVTVHCLRPHGMVGKVEIVGRFLHLIWKLRHEYDAIFVHMNQEYVLLGGLFWRILGKKIFFWRNHSMGDWKTTLAITLSYKVFYTSTDSFTAHFRNSQIMPAGIDVELFQKNADVERLQNSLLMFGRIAPVKHIELAIDAVVALKERGTPVIFSIVGDSLPKDQGYKASLVDRAEAKGVSGSVTFGKGISFTEAPALYRRHHIFLNFTPSGSFDKTVIEALASGCKVLVSNDSMRKILPEVSWTNGSTQDIISKIEGLLAFDVDAEKGYALEVGETVHNQSLDMLVDIVDKLISCITHNQETKQSV